jgi:hypothetical protein
MIFVTSIISSQEWSKLRDAAQQAFPGEVLARGRSCCTPLVSSRRFRTCFSGGLTSSGGGEHSVCLLD